jgi:hypothetical protein
MRKIFIALLVLALFLPSLLLADCLYLSGYTSWVIESDRKIIFYRGDAPFATITLQDCKVDPNSNIRLTKGYMCESDRIVIDGEECLIMSLDGLQ